ncbi:MAG TPA: GDP-mannose 4,6-dehydratase [Gemmatimonadales bacterium]|jgi:dTDP-glucose 4,6-dehydratase|nr:GDP-mannose 4,6-dehydratase [Gemmatimonadales bacterium]
MKLVLTGGCGFIGHHVVEHILRNTDWQIVILDKLSYASSGFQRLRDIAAFDSSRVSLFAVDFAAPLSPGVLQEIGDVDCIVHMGAETDVDRSITDPEQFVRTNVLGTFHMLEFARRQPKLKWFVYFSTDEVFGPAPGHVAYQEWDRYDSRNPYAATKAAGEELALAWANTYGVPLFVTHTMNVFGERQHRNKFIPKVMNFIAAGDIVPIHADPTGTISGSRFWIHARNVASALCFLLEHAAPREKYNIVGEREVSNYEMARFVADVMGAELQCQFVDFHSSRPGHDLRYALDGSRMAALGWALPLTFEQSLRKTIEWTLHHPRWLHE